MPDRKTVAVDLDGVLADFSMGWQGVDVIGDPIPGAIEFTRQLSAFADVLIWTTRCNPEVGRGEGANLLRNRVRDWLDRHGFAYADIWTGVGKPIAAAFVDDRAVWCSPTTGGYSRIGQPFDIALLGVKAHCDNVPAGCSLRHDVPEIGGGA